MAFSPVEIRHLKLGRAMVGYARDETDRVLAEIAESFEDVWRDRADLADKVEKLETDLHRYKDTETLLRATLISAEKAAAEQKDNARREAEQIVSEAHAEARRVRGLLQSALMVVGPAVQEEVDRWPETTAGTVNAEVA